MSGRYRNFVVNIWRLPERIFEEQGYMNQESLNFKPKKWFQAKLIKPAFLSHITSTFVNRAFTVVFGKVKSICNSR
jgi:hypothetical protein